ncbi:MAG TPA: phosphatidylglycerophosphatase A [Stellaceae bacterium]|nr:phosphatidylglycerophosphatase A [Stellaceae bacterium]
MTEEPRPAPAGLHPATLIATWFGAGLLPWFPGTWGSLAALPFAWAIAWLFGPRALLIATAGLFFIGWWAAHRVVRASGAADPGSVVVDEVAGQWLTLVVTPPDAVGYVAGFLLFRLCDILKPWPARWIDQHRHGGFGIMADDIIAAFYAATALLLLLLLLGKPIG